MRDGTTLSGEKSKSKTELIHRKGRSGVSWAVAFAYGSRSRREVFLDQFLSIADLTLLEVELLAFYRVSQKLTFPQDLHSIDPSREDRFTRAKTNSWY